MGTQILGHSLLNFCGWMFERFHSSGVPDVQVDLNLRKKDAKPTVTAEGIAWTDMRAFKRSCCLQNNLLCYS